MTERAKNLEFYRTHNRRLRDRAMIRSIFTRDKPGTTDPAIAEFLADEELKFGDQVPTGTYLDMTSKLPLVDPKKVLAPVMLVRGEYDGIATMDDLSDFFLQLPNGDRQFVILPGMAHSVVQGSNRQVFWARAARVPVDAENIAVLAPTCLREGAVDGSAAPPPPTIRTIAIATAKIWNSKPSPFLVAAPVHKKPFRQCNR